MKFKIGDIRQRGLGHIVRCSLCGGSKFSPRHLLMSLCASLGNFFLSMTWKIDGGA